MDRPIERIFRDAFCALTTCAFVLAVALALVLSLQQAHAASSGSEGTCALTVAETVETGAGSELAAAQPIATNVSVKGRARVAFSGWQPWVSQGNVIGTKTTKGLRRFRLKLDGAAKGSGGIAYTAYDTDLGWGGAHANGKVAGVASKPIQAVRVWLTGDLSKHYDVLYRGYVKGKGWLPWTKNKASCGIVRYGAYLSAIQVKVSPKTEEASGRTATTVGVRYQARLKNYGWQSWTGDGKVAGKARVGKTITGLSLALDTGGLKGGVKYRAYVWGRKWSQGWKSSGKTVGVSNRRMEAVQFKLTGEMASTYDIYYSSYVAGYGWLDWAKNGQVSGSTGLNLPLAAVRVKLVAKGAKVAGAGDERTVNARRKVLDGIDISSWQAGIKIANVPADFVIVKATGGTSYTNPYFRAHANATLKAGKLLGLYHFACERNKANSATKEADYFVSKVRPYLGRAVLVLDWENETSRILGVKWAKKFLDRVYAKTGVRPLVYMSKNYTRSYDWTSVAKRYKLWVAQYPNYNRTGYQIDPWTDSYSYGAWSSPTMFQYTSSGDLDGYGGTLDLNVFYGKAKDWKTLASTS